jgi:hypothetical protein
MLKEYQSYGLASGWATRENSSTSNLPPGLSTRHISRSAMSLCVMLRRPKATLTKSKCWSGNGSFSASHTSVGSTTPLSISRLRPTRSMASLMSVCTTRPAGAHFAGKGQRQVARAARQCRAPAGLPAGWPPSRCRPSRRGAGRRHQVVHQVVLGGDRVEHATHTACLFFLIDRLETEMRGAHGGNASGEGVNPANAWDIRFLSLRGTKGLLIKRQ